MSFIYVASPYSGTIEERTERHAAVEKYVAYLISNGMTAVSPIVHSHQLSLNHDMPADFDFWQNYCLDLLRHCDEVYVLKLPGWVDSIGVNDEIEEAMECDIPVLMIDCKTYDMINEWGSL